VVAVEMGAAVVRAEAKVLLAAEKEAGVCVRDHSSSPAATNTSANFSLYILLQAKLITSAFL
jgi:hypothetical protein